MLPDWEDYDAHPREPDDTAPLEFEWDAANVSHIAEHGVEPDEVVDVFYNDHIDYPAYEEGGETRYDVVGRTDNGRILLVVYTLRESAIRVVTAFRPNEADIRAFQRRFPREQQ